MRTRSSPLPSQLLTRPSAISTWRHVSGVHLRAASCRPAAATARLRRALVASPRWPTCGCRRSRRTAAPSAAGSACRASTSSCVVALATAAASRSRAHRRGAPAGTRRVSQSCAGTQGQQRVVCAPESTSPPAAASTATAASAPTSTDAPAAATRGSPRPAEPSTTPMDTDEPHAAQPSAAATAADDGGGEGAASADPDKDVTLRDLFSSDEEEGGGALSSPLTHALAPNA